MKKNFITLLLAALLVILISCHDKDPSAVPPSSTSLTSASTAITTLPEIDMNDLLEKVINNHSRYLGSDASAELQDPDKNQGEVIFYIGKGEPDEITGYRESYQIWMVSGVTTKLYGDFDKYKVELHRQSPLSLPIKITDYFHTKYLDLLFENLKFEKADSYPDGKECLKILSIYANDLSYDVYEDMKIYCKNNDSISVSSTPVDMPYLYMMGVVNTISGNLIEDYDFKGDFSYTYGKTLNEDKNFGKTVDEITVKENGKEITYYITESGTVYRRLSSQASFHPDGYKFAEYTFIGDVILYYPDAVNNGFLASLTK